MGSSGQNVSRRVCRCSKPRVRCRTKSLQLCVRTLYAPNRSNWSAIFAHTSKMVPKCQGDSENMSEALGCHMGRATNQQIQRKHPQPTRDEPMRRQLTFRRHAGQADPQKKQGQRDRQRGETSFGEREYNKRTGTSAGACGSHRTPARIEAKIHEPGSFSDQELNAQGRQISSTQAETSVPRITT